MLLNINAISVKTSVIYAPHLTRYIYLFQQMSKQMETTENLTVSIKNMLLYLSQKLLNFSVQ